MPADLISLNEASWRLECSEISGAELAELLCKSEPLLLGLFPGRRVPDTIDLSRLTSFRAQPENVVVAGDVTWTEVKIRWKELRTAFQDRAVTVSWTWHSDITREVLERASRPDPARRLLGDRRPPPRLTISLPAVPKPERRASDEWFEAAVYSGSIPASGKAPAGKRGPRSHKRENAGAAMWQDLRAHRLTTTALKSMSEKLLADRYRVSRDTARKARHDVLGESPVEISTSTNDK
jgi:hypothetical protein